MPAPATDRVSAGDHHLLGDQPVRMRNWWLAWLMPMSTVSSAAADIPTRQPASGTPAGCVDDKVGSYELFAFPILAAAKSQQHADHSLLLRSNCGSVTRLPHNLDVRLQDPSPQLPFQVRPAGHVEAGSARGMPRPEDMAGF